MPVAKMFFDYGELVNHFEDHGGDFGASDPSDYLLRAQNFLNADLNLNKEIQECERASTGDILRFNSRTNEFAIMRHDGIIKTYYKPVPEWLRPAHMSSLYTHDCHSNQEYFEVNCSS